MAAKKPPPLPPDTAPGGGDPPLGVPPNAGERNNAENPESIDPIQPEIRRTVVSTVVPHEPHKVLFTVLKDGNAIRFLSELLTNLLLVDVTSKILPTMDAHDAYPVLGRNSVFPTNATDAKSFAKAYLADLKVSSKGDMKGTVLLRTQAHFSTLKKNKNFRNWLDGSIIAPLRPKVLLVKTDMKGSVRVSAGFFFNVVPRHDNATNFHTQIDKSLYSTLQESGAIPEFQIEVYPLHGSGGTKARVYRMLTSSVSNVKILTEKMAVIMPKPSTDISYIPQKVWDSLLASKKDEYIAMQRVFDSNHNSRIFVGLKNAKMLLARTTAAGINTGPAQGISIFTWLTRVKSADGCNMFPKVFECSDGNIELWHHMTHDQEARAWMSTALAEIARLSGMTIDNDRMRAEAMFKNPEKVWTNLERMKTGTPTLPAQRSVYMDFSPPTGIITFPNRKAVHGRQRRGPSEVKLIFDIEAATTVSVLTPDTRSRASSRSRRRQNKNGTAGTEGTASSLTTAAVQDDDGKAAAALAAKTATQTADAAITKHPPKMKTAHQGAYDTIADRFGNKIPVVAIDGKWVPLTEATLLESRRKAPPTNYGLTARVTPQSRTASEAVLPAQTITRQQPSTVVQETAVNIHPAATASINLAPATVFGTLDEFPPLPRRGDTTSEAMEIVDDEGMRYSEDIDIDEHEEMEDDSGYESATSYGAKSTMSASTAGQSIVTFAQMAMRQDYVISETTDELTEHIDSVAEPTKEDGPTQLQKLESARKKEAKKAAKKSSLQAAAIQGAIERRAARATNDSQEAPRPPILGPPPRDDAGRFLDESDIDRRSTNNRAGTEEKPRPPMLGPHPRDSAGRLIPDKVRNLPPRTTDEQGDDLKRRAMAALQRRNSATAETAAEERMKQMELQMQKMQQLVEENARLNHVIQQLTANYDISGALATVTRPRIFGQGIKAALTMPTEHIDALCDIPQVSTEMVEWSSPTRDKRRSKKTPLEAEMPIRTPPRPPHGTPQTKKKPRVSASPSANRYEALADASMDDVLDDDMDEAIEESLAEVEERLDNLKIRNTHVELDSIKKNGASRKE
jgi:hypothetical protein